METKECFECQMICNVILLLTLLIGYLNLSSGNVAKKLILHQVINKKGTVFHFGSPLLHMGNLGNRAIFRLSVFGGFTPFGGLGQKTQNYHGFRVFVR